MSRPMGPSHSPFSLLYLSEHFLCRRRQPSSAASLYVQSTCVSACVWICVPVGTIMGLCVCVYVVECVYICVCVLVYVGGWVYTCKRVCTRVYSCEFACGCMCTYMIRICVLMYYAMFIQYYICVPQWVGHPYTTVLWQRHVYRHITWDTYSFEEGHGAEISEK
jgi:hypothetical protein